MDQNLSYSNIDPLYTSCTLSYSKNYQTSSNIVLVLVQAIQTLGQLSNQVLFLYHLETIWLYHVDVLTKVTIKEHCLNI